MCGWLEEDISAWIEARPLVGAGTGGGDEDAGDDS